VTGWRVGCYKFAHDFLPWSGLILGGILSGPQASFPASPVMKNVQLRKFSGRNIVCPKETHTQNLLADTEPLEEARQTQLEKKGGCCDLVRFALS